MAVYNDCSCTMIFPFVYLQPRICDENFIGGVRDIQQHMLKQAGTYIPFLFGICTDQPKFH